MFGIMECFNKLEYFQTMHIYLYIYSEFTYIYVHYILIAYIYYFNLTI